MKFNKQAYMAKDLRVHNIRMESENGEEGGDSGELVPGRSIRFTGINLTENQFNELFGHDAASKFFFDFSNGGKGAPAHENCGTIWLDQVYKDCSGTIIFGTSRKEVAFEDARVKNLSIKLKKEQRFGSLSLTLVAALPVKIDVLHMEAFFGKVVTLQLAFGEAELQQAADQQQLGLEGGTVAGEDEGESRIDKTRVLTPGQAEREEDTQRQLGEALRGLEKQDAEKEPTAPVEDKPARRTREARAH